jgi:hypothetical protein
VRWVFANDTGAAHMLPLTNAELAVLLAESRPHQMTPFRPGRVGSLFLRSSGRRRKCLLRGPADPTEGKVLSKS